MELGLSLLLLFTSTRQDLPCAWKRPAHLYLENRKSYW